MFQSHSTRFLPMLEAFIASFCKSDMNKNISFIALYCDVYHGLFDVCIDQLDNMNHRVALHRSELMAKREDMLNAQDGWKGAKYYLTQNRNTFSDHTKYCADFQFPFLKLYEFPELEKYVSDALMGSSQELVDEQCLHYCWLLLNGLAKSLSLALVESAGLLRLGFELHDDELGLIVTHELVTVK